MYGCSGNKTNAKEEESIGRGIQKRERKVEGNDQNPK